MPPLVAMRPLAPRTRRTSHPLWLHHLSMRSGPAAAPAVEAYGRRTSSAPPPATCDGKLPVAGPGGDGHPLIVSPAMARLADSDASDRRQVPMPPTSAVPSVASTKQVRFRTELAVLTLQMAQLLQLIHLPSYVCVLLTRLYSYSLIWAKATTYLYFKSSDAVKSLLIAFKDKAHVPHQSYIEPQWVVKDASLNRDSHSIWFYKTIRNTSSYIKTVFVWTCAPSVLTDELGRIFRNNIV